MLMMAMLPKRSISEKVDNSKGGNSVGDVEIAKKSGKSKG